MHILDLATGAQLGTMPSDGPPAIDSARGVIITQVQPKANYVGCDPCNLVARSLSTGAVLWTFTGDGGLSVAPTIIDGVVYTASWNGNMYGLNEATGALVWGADLRANVTANDEGARQPVAFIGAGHGMVTVSTSGGVVAFRSSTTARVAAVQSSWTGSYGACSFDGTPNGNACTWPFTQIATGRDVLHIAWQKGFGATFTAKLINSAGGTVAAAISRPGASDLYVTTRSLPAGTRYRVQIVDHLQANLFFTVHMFQDQPRAGITSVSGGPATLTFAKSPVGTTTGKTITVTNTGSTDVTLGRLSLAKGSSKTFTRGFDSCSRATLPPGWSCTARVNFRARGTTAVTGKLVIPTTAGRKTIALHAGKTSH